MPIVVPVHAKLTTVYPTSYYLWDDMTTMKSIAVILSHKVSTIDVICMRMCLQIWNTYRSQDLRNELLLDNFQQTLKKHALVHNITGYATPVG